MTDFLQYAEQHSLALFPLRSDTKTPAIERGFYSATMSPADWRSWIAEGHQLAISGCLSNVILIDVDAHGDRDEAWTQFVQWCDEIGIAVPAPYGHSANGGWHFSFRCPEGFDPHVHRGVRSIKVSHFRPLAPGEDDAERISVRNRGYNVAPGSMFSGKPYVLAPNAPPPAPYSEDTAALFSVLESSGGASITGAVPDAVGGISHDGIHYDQLLWWIEQKVARWEGGDESLSNDEWISIGKRIKLSFPGEDGLAAFLAMSWEDRHDSITRRWNDPRDFKVEGDNLEALPALLRKDITWMFREVAGCPMPAPPLVPSAPFPMPLAGAYEIGEGDEPRTLPVFSAASLDGLPIPVRKWHVRDWIPGDTVTLLYGDGGTGKSLLALQLLVSTAIGRPWLNRLTETGPCLFITAEDSRQEVHIRLADVARESKVPLAAMSNLHIVSLAGEDAIIAAPEGRSTALSPTALFSAIEQHIAALRPRLVVLDTLADLFGGNEIDRSQARQFIGLLRGWALQYEVAILLLAHPSVSGMAKGTGASGSTGWNNSVRSRLYFDRIRAEDNSEPDPDARVLRSMKSNYGRIGDEIVVRWQRGIFAPDAVVSVGGDPVSVAAKAERVFVELLRKYIAQNRYVSVSEGKSSAPFIFAKDAALQGVNKKELKAAMERLLVRGVIENAPYGAPSKKMFRLYVSADAPTCQRLLTPANGVPTVGETGVPTPTNGMPTPANGVCVLSPIPPVTLARP